MVQRICVSYLLHLLRLWLWLLWLWPRLQRRRWLDLRNRKRRRLDFRDRRTCLPLLGLLLLLLLALALLLFRLLGSAHLPLLTLLGGRLLSPLRCFQPALLCLCLLLLLLLPLLRCLLLARRLLLTCSLLPLLLLGSVALSCLPLLLLLLLLLLLPLRLSDMCDGRASSSRRLFQVTVVSSTFRLCGDICCDSLRFTVRPADDSRGCSRDPRHSSIRRLHAAYHAP